MSQPASLCHYLHTARLGLGHGATTSDAAHCAPVPAPSEDLSPAGGVCHRHLACPTRGQRTLSLGCRVSLAKCTHNPGPPEAPPGMETRWGDTSCNAGHGCCFAEAAAGGAFSRDREAFGFVGVQGRHLDCECQTDSAGPRPASQGGAWASAFINWLLVELAHPEAGIGGVRGGIRRPM